MIAQLRPTTATATTTATTANPSLQQQLATLQAASTQAAINGARSIALLTAAATGRYFIEYPEGVDMFGLTKDDFVEQIQDIITVGDFYDMAAGGQIIFT